MSETTNRQLALDFFRLLTSGAFFTDDAGNRLTGEAEAAMFRQTKQWRQQLWKEFYKVEERLCPRPQAQPRPDYAKQIAKESLSSRQ